ncbi:MAG: META domain-containing protein [Bacteroidetes bacterium]|nr:META domain-containing protein [Bacteroidota bacterium]
MKQLIAITGLFFITLNTACVNHKPITDKSNSNSSHSDSALLTEKYWKLVELNGTPIIWKEGWTHEPQITFRSLDHRINGNGGCNTFFGTYQLGSGNSIHLSQMGATMMACPNMETETTFLQTLEKVDNYTVKGDTLMLNKARMAPLARFIAVYMD